MENKWTWLIAGGIFLLLVVIQVILRAKHPVRKAAGGVLTGVAALVAVNITGILTGVTLPISVLSVGVSVVAGIPGVTMLLLLNLMV